MHAAEHDHLSVGGGGLAGEFERIADEICDVLDLRILVVVRKDHGLALPLQLGNGCRQLGVGRATAGDVVGSRENQGSGPT